MLNRIGIALILVPLTLYVYLYGDLSFLIFATAISGIGIYEIYQMFEKKKIKVNKYLGVVMGGLIPIALYTSLTKGKDVFSKTVGNSIDMSRGTLLIILAAFLLIGIRIYQNKVEGSASYIAYTLLGIVYVGFLFSHIIPLKYMRDGSHWLVTIQLLVWTSDTFAYLVGVKIGKKFFSRGLCEISPNKSIEGSLGSIFFTTLVMILIKFLLFKNLNINGIHLVILPVIVAIIGQLGDLAESIFKREFKVKDSGKILGGHGGILDRYDSLIWVFPVVYYYIKFFL